MCFSWPLPRYVGSGIPAAAHRTPADIQNLIPGDHLQFMYYCWLAGDMLAGKTPLFYNLYEFNTGNDRERYEPDAYYIPFSLIYSASAWLGGRAFGWNLTGFISLWLTYLLTWLLARRWTRNELVAVAAALLGIVLPFRWINLFGGSPAGFAMVWIPAILLGVDLAVRNDRVWGGVLAGAAILLAAWTDSHVFFFGTLVVPVWCVIAMAARSDFQWRSVLSYRRLFVALLPIVLFACAALLFPVLMKALYRSVIGAAPLAHAIGPRTLREIMLYSPDWRGFFGISPLNVSEHIYLGLGFMVFLVAGLTLKIIHRKTKDPSLFVILREPLVILSIILAAIGIMLLALGARGPRHGSLFEFCRWLVPPYAMIRQPAKIFCLMPSLLAVASAVALTAFVQLRANRIWAVLAPAIFAVLIVFGYARQSNPTISLLEQKQGAYAAVAADSKASGAIPRALVLPLWPGDSHYASIYQYFASIYRIRMLDGYNPFIKEGYFDNVFRRFESVNQGGLYEDQLAGLLGMNVRYIIIHEDLFPEKVSPFPVAATLQQLLRNPRLELLRQDGSVWAFKIPDLPRNETNDDFNAARFSRAAATPSAVGETVRQNGADRSATLPSVSILFPARRFEMEKTVAERQVTVLKSASAGGRTYVALTNAGASLRTVPVRVASVSNLNWLVRARGHGSLAGTLMVDERATASKAIGIQSDDWTWVSVPAPAYRGFSAIGLKLALAAGAVDLDLTLLTAGPWLMLNPGESLTLPASLFFHAGHIDLKSGSVMFSRNYDRQGIVFYGPKLPLPKGTYEIDIGFASSAKPGTKVAVVNLEQRDNMEAGVPVPLIAGQPAQGRWRQYENLPFNLALVYEKNADLEIQGITIKRLK